MTGSELYFKRAKEAIRRHQGQEESVVVTAIREVLFQQLGELPDNLKHDVFNFYWEKWIDSEVPGRTVYQLAEAPMNLIDFMTGTLLPDEVEFSEEEWAMIRDGINANADTMDLRLLNQLMATLVEKKRY